MNIIAHDNDNNYDNNKTMYKKHLKDTFLNKPHSKLSKKKQTNKQTKEKEKNCKKKHMKRDIIIYKGKQNR